MSSDTAPDVSALAINVTISEELRWTGTRRGEEFTLTTLNIRLLPDGRLAAKAYGRPTSGGRGTYVSFPRARQARTGDPDRHSCQPRRRALGRAPRPQLMSRWRQSG
jgi:hypothetical protein